METIPFAILTVLTRTPQQARPAWFESPNVLHEIVLLVADRPKPQAEPHFGAHDSFFFKAGKTAQPMLAQVVSVFYCVLQCLQVLHADNADKVFDS